MILSQPVLSRKYFSLRSPKMDLSKDLAVKYFLSWEDGLWELIRAKKIAKGSVILVPEFYCMDVVGNMKQHGLVPVFYPMDRYFRTKEVEIEKKIKQYKPKIVVVFHVAGMENNLMQKMGWIKRLEEKIILIEDSVHRTLEPAKIRIFRKNHLVMDSWRKVVPIAGSAMYGKREDLEFVRPKLNREITYQMGVYGWWLVMQTYWILAKLFNSTGLAKIGQWAMLQGYDLIGDSKTGVGLWSLFVQWHGKLDFRALETRKRKQFLKYKKQYPIWREMGEGSNLRGFPVILKKNKAKGEIKRLVKGGIMVRSELMGCPWTEKQEVIFLPMGLQYN